MKTDIQSLLPQNQIEEIKTTYLNGAHWQDVLNFTNAVLDSIRSSPHAGEGVSHVVARSVLRAALARYDELRASIHGCTDGGCLIRIPHGMHTNGGCRCNRDGFKAQRVMRAANELRKALAEIE